LHLRRPLEEAEMAKTPSKATTYYFDACVFLSLINEESGRCDTVEAILDDAEHQRCEVHTSQMSVAEVSFGEQEKKGKVLSAAVEKNINSLWHPGSPVRLVDLHQMISEEAKSIIRKAMKDGWTLGETWSVKPSDAVHIATAKIVKAQYFFTYDGRLLKLKHTGIEIREPFLMQGRLGIINP
jgi:predicted nucleic acid-binding protein